MLEWGGDMALSSLLLSNFRKRKGIIFTIMILGFLITAMLSLSIDTITRANQEFESEFKRTETPDVFITLPKNQLLKGHEILAKLKNQNQVREAKLVPTVVGDGDAYFGKKQIKESYLIRVMQQRDQKALLEPLDGKNGIWLPSTYQVLYHIQRNDVLTLKEDGERFHIKVAGFFEDPAFGSNLTGSKQFLVSKKIFQQISSLSVFKGNNQTALQVFIKNYHTDDFQKTMRKINQKTGIMSIGDTYFDHALMVKSSMLMPNALLVILLVFAFLMLIITGIVMKYAIHVSVENDFTNLGVLSALGFTKRFLFSVEILQVLLPFLVGMVLGSGASVYLAPKLGRLIMDGSGVIFRGGIDFRLIFLIAVMLLASAMLLCLLSAKKVLNMSAVSAIRKGSGELSFASRINLPLMKLTFLPLQLRMAFKSVLSSWGQYMTLIVVSGVIVFTVSSMTGLKEHLSSPEALNQVFGGGIISDVSINTKEAGDKFDSFVKAEEKKLPITKEFHLDNEYLAVDDMKMLVKVSDIFNSGEEMSILEGRAPKYKNEIIVTKALAQMMGKEIGDWVKVSNGEKKSSYLIVGYNQSVHDGGKVASMSTKAVKQVIPGFSSASTSLILKKDVNLKRTIQKIRDDAREAHVKVAISNDKQNTKDLLRGVQMGVTAVLTLFYLLSILLSALIIMMLSQTMLKQKELDFAVYRSQGFTVNQLRRQFAYGFGVMVFLGALLGCVAHELWSKSLFSLLFRKIGISEFTTVFSLPVILVPTMIIVAFSIVFAYLASKKIKKINISGLMTE